MLSSRLCSALHTPASNFTLEVGRYPSGHLLAPVPHLRQLISEELTVAMGNGVRLITMSHCDEVSFCLLENSSQCHSILVLWSVTAIDKKDISDSQSVQDRQAYVILMA